MTDKEIIESWFRHPNTLKTEGDRFTWFAREIQRLTREECAVKAWSVGMDYRKSEKTVALEDPREVGSTIAEAIRAMED